MNTLKTVTGLALAITLGACAQPYGMGPGMGPGYGPGCGAGGGWGMGMMGGGCGPGAMGHAGAMWGLERLDLTAEQRARIAQIQDEARQRHRELARAWHAEGGPRRGPFDDQAERRDYEAMAAHHKQMFEFHLQTRQRILEVLTPPQREQLGRAWQGAR